MDTDNQKIYKAGCFKWETMNRISHDELAAQTKVLRSFFKGDFFYFFESWMRALARVPFKYRVNINRKVAKMVKMRSC